MDVWNSKGSFILLYSQKHARVLKKMWSLNHMTSYKTEFTMGSKVQTDFEWYNPENNLEKKNKIEAA